ncbi:histidine--tRNA ligase [Harryflintia acetispora]|uniref:histidine--tRNA ligase n=1 Tax=Harryflintia acetispora TaxID=1849041 RepID=UPI0018989B7E|nr:histidine--tRNA ligase [Harryflintia acetispora]
MAVITNAPRGTQDVLPAQSARWQYIENTLLRTAELFGFREIRTPVFEHTELFSRSVGDTTDVVQKEMYTFLDKGKRSVTLRPEGTAGVVRAVLQNGLLGGALPLRTCYVIPCFRYEKPQAGRLREFHQFGVEMFGPKSPAADAQVIALANEIFQTLGIEGLELHINSIGCPECRAKYQQALREYFTAHLGALCETCQGRLEKNPMRILDCKSPECHAVVEGAPLVLDYICDDCREHFEGLKKRLDLLGISYSVDPKIVRGLDYYTRTVFEFVSQKIGAQGTVCGGGRYDGLVEELGGSATPALGFAMGLERLLLQMDACGCLFPEENTCDIYLAGMGEAGSLRAQQLCYELQQEGFYAECDCMERSVKAQMKYADKLGAKYAAVLGESELQSGECTVKDMRGGKSVQVSLTDFAGQIYRLLLEGAYTEVIEAGEQLQKGQE